MKLGVQVKNGSTAWFETRPLATIRVAMSEPRVAAQWVSDTATSGLSAGIDVHLLNAYSLALSSEDRAFQSVLANSKVNFPDGKPLALVTRFSKARLHQVRGPQLFNDVMRLGRSSRLKHFLLGSTEDTLRLLEAELVRRYPGVTIVGSFSPPFREMTNQELTDQDQVIRASGAHIVWVGLGTPKQDFEAHRIASEMPVIAIAVGAAFDFVAGTKPEAPAWMTKMGLEWVFRFATEPRRLWRRYLVGNVLFLRAVWAGSRAS
jgi:N-acetylglucosaminyldiphosphoundecaprenol N-acetyl-beta-D-mannosaminyltransferase